MWLRVTKGHRVLKYDFYYMNFTFPIQTYHDIFRSNCYNKEIFMMFSVHIWDGRMNTRDKTKTRSWDERDSNIFLPFVFSTMVYPSIRKTTSWRVSKPRASITLLQTPQSTDILNWRTLYLPFRSNPSFQLTIPDLVHKWFDHPSSSRS